MTIPFDQLTPYEQQSYHFRVIAAERLAERKNCSGAAVEWGGVDRNNLTSETHESKCNGPTGFQATSISPASTRSQALERR